MTWESSTVDMKWRTDKMAKNEKERANNCVFIVKERNCKKERERERSQKKSGTGFCYQKNFCAVLCDISS
jgi:hypothetical protein